MKPERETPDAPLRAAHAGLMLAGALLFAALPTPPATPLPCDHPSEALAEGDRSVAVACDPESGGKPALRGPARLLFGLRLDLNRASAESLEALPEIGPRRAAAIVAARSELPFHAVSDLRRVSGIGPRTLEALAGWTEVQSSPGSTD